jgi:hypothetical protein
MRDSLLQRIIQRKQAEAIQWGNVRHLKKLNADSGGNSLLTGGRIRSIID